MSDTTQLKFRGTQGEWRTVYDGHICIGVGVFKGRGFHEMICNTILPDTDKEYEGQKKSLEADSHLIAAAPDLLDAAQKTLDTLIQVKKRYDKTLTDAVYFSISHRINDLTDAINKALNYE